MNSPHATAETASQSKDKVTDLIALLDRYLHLTGHTLAPGRELKSLIQAPSIVFPSPSNNDIPTALQIFASVSLSSHLRDQGFDHATAQTLEQRIRAIHTHNPPTISAAHARLNAEYAACAPAPSQTLRQTFAAKTSLADKIATLRTHQHHNPLAYQTPSFSVTVVSNLDYVGSIFRTETLYFPKKKTDWSYFHLALQRATTCSQTEAAGYPTGYPLQAGAWLVQPTRDNIPTSKTPTHALRTPRDFRILRNWVEDDEKLGVLIWHEKLWARSRELRTEALERKEEVKEWASWALGPELRNEDGSLMFEPGWGDDFDYEGVDFGLEGMGTMVPTGHEMEESEEEVSEEE